ncbi:MAG: VOC family protein [Alphaproteobacteria bacterium]|nr:MAG: VOC family protein [Alphaproteobacteria bacterium]
MSRAFGPIMQNGYVVRDIREAIAHWTRVLGVGPFFVLDPVEFGESFYRGQPLDLDLTVAIAYSGDFQIELIHQNNDARSIYTDFLEVSPPGLHHVCVCVDDVDGVIEAQGLTDKIVQHGHTAAGVRFAYVDTILHGGTMLEVIERDKAMMDAFDQMKAAAARWDGEKAFIGKLRD